MRAVGGSWRGNPYVQAALTYPRRLFATKLRIVIVILLAILCGVMLSFSSCMRSPNESLVMALIPVAWLAGLLAMHVKEQFAAPRAHLTPGFRKAHIIVAAAATLILLIAFYVPPAWTGNARSIGLLAVIVVLCGMMYWFALLQTNWFAWAFLFQLLFTWSSGARDVLQLIITGQYERQSAGLLLCGAALIVAAGVRCFRLNEDMPEYHRRTLAQMQKERMSGQMSMPDNAGPLPRGLTNILRQQAVAYLIRHVRRADRSAWSRVCRWQAGMATGWRVWLWGLLPLALQMFLEWYLPQRTPGVKVNLIVANSFFFLPLVICVSQLYALFMQRIRTAGFELMLPVARRDYVRQVGLALTLGFNQLTGVLYVSTIVWWYALSKNPPPLGDLCGAAAVALLVQTAIYGIMAFVMSLTRSPIILAIPFAVLPFGMMLLMQFGCNDTLWAGTIPTAAAMAAVGVLLGYVAYRRWLAADYD